MNYDANLILEGGGMRGVYTGGVLEYFMERDLYFNKNYGVSMGACQGMSYLSRQPGRNKVVTVDLAEHKEYMKLTGIFDGRGLFNKEFVFDKIPNRLVKYDYDRFFAEKEEMYVVVTSCDTGQAHYIDVKSLESNEEMMSVILASSSLPYIASPVEFQGKMYMDGGLADSIPIRHAYNNGCDKHVVILTRDRGYKKEPGEQKKRMLRFVYKNYPGLIDAVEHRNANYNESRLLVSELEAAGKLFAIYPSRPLPASRTDRDYDKLLETYQMGYEDAKACFDDLIMYLER